VKKYVTKTKVVITPEEKARWKSILQRTWDFIAYDAILCQWSYTRSFKDWIAKEVFSSKSYVI
jgi:hypothetical protein